METVTTSDDAVSHSLWVIGGVLRSLDVDKLAPASYVEALDSIDSEVSVIMSLAPRDSEEYAFGRRLKAVSAEIRKLFNNSLRQYEQAVAKQFAVLRKLVESHPGTAMKLTPQQKSRAANVHRVLASLHTASKSVKVGYKVAVGVEVEGARGPKITTEEREGEVTVPLSDNYHTFLHDVIDAIQKQAGGEFDLDDLDHQPSLLRMFMEGHESGTPYQHPATREFYDWVESPFGGGANWRTGFGTKTQHGFAHTPYTWDYYETTDDFLNAYGYVYIDDPNMYDEDENGNTTPKSDEEQAENIFGYLDPSNHTSGSMLHAERGLLTADDYFFIGYA